MPPIVWVILGIGIILYNQLTPPSATKLIVIGTANIFGKGTYIDIGYLLIAWGLIRYALLRRRKEE